MISSSAHLSQDQVRRTTSLMKAHSYHWGEKQIRKHSVMQWDLRQDVFLRLKTGAQKTVKPLAERKWGTVTKGRIDGDETLG